MSKKSDKIPTPDKGDWKGPGPRSSVPYVPEKEFPGTTEGSETSASGSSDDGGGSAQGDDTSGDNAD